ncbi:MAG: hypothetical protein WC406_01455 [Methanoregula sp.]|jgi:hypothetical protein
MASIETIGRAESLSSLIGRVTGIKPSQRIEGDQVVLYYEGSDLDRVREMVSRIRPMDDIRLEYLPVIAPMAIKKAMPYALGLVAIGFIAGRLL